MENQRKGRAPKVDRRMFDACKIMFNNGAMNLEVVKYMGLSKKTVQRIKSSENYEDYLQYLAAMNIEYQKKYAKKKASKSEPVQEEKTEPVVQEPAPQVVEHRQSVTVQTTYYVNQKLDKIEEVLKSISAKLACIIDDLYGTNTKKEE